MQIRKKPHLHLQSHNGYIATSNQRNETGDDVGKKNCLLTLIS